MSEDVHDSANELPSPPEKKGPQFYSVCPHKDCTMIYYGYTRKGADALLSMHLDDHSRGWVNVNRAVPAYKDLSNDDRALLSSLKVSWGE